MTSIIPVGTEPVVAPETPVVTPEVAPAAPAAKPKRTPKAPAPQPEATPEEAPSVSAWDFNFTVVDN